ncbi:MAG: recombinase family protein [Clostridium sp.]
MFPIPTEHENRPEFDENYILNATRQDDDKTLPRLKVAAYIRVSTDLQDQENSYAVQEQYFQQIIESNPLWKLVGIYSDYGISGTSKEKRVGFCRLIRHCQEGKIDRILCKSISRFARNTADFSSALFLLRNCQVTIFFEKENLDSAELKNEFILSVLGAFAQEESRSISSNIMEGNKMRNSQGDVRNVKLYGYRFSGNWICNETGYKYREVEVVEEEARVVQFVFQKVADDQSYSEIARWLNQQKIPAPYNDYKRKRILHSRKGQLPQYYIKNHHTPIIDRTLYEEVHAVLRQKSLKKIKHNKNETNPFSKRLICSECGRFYCMATRNDHLVWYCPSTRKTNGLQICHAKSFTEEEITYIVKKAARKLLKNAVPRLEKVLNDDYVERDRSTYKGQLADIDKAIDADLEEIEHIKAACLNNKTMNASEIARQKQTILDLRKKLRKNKREYKSISAKLDHLENYWEELEPDFELRAKALQWLQSLPQGRTRTRKFLLGATDMYFKALFLDITIHSKSKYTIHWFDDVYTKVILRNTGGNITHA